MFTAAAVAEYPVHRPEKDPPPLDQRRGDYVIHVDRPQQVVWGMGFEIQSDSIASGNNGLPDAFTSVPRDLTPSERNRLADEMLSGFRYCRLAGGLYWRGLDAEQKTLQPRWPTQLKELKALLDRAGVEGLSFEYWSFAPYWKANRQYVGRDGTENILRCFGQNFASDPDYHGDVDRFLADFAQALRTDLQTLTDAGFKISMWGLSNEPWVDSPYSSCKFTVPQYGRTFKAVAPTIRAFDPAIKIIACTAWDVPRFIAPVMKTEYAKYVDALVVHAIGKDSKTVPDNLRRTRKLIEQPLPLFQNEYEYLNGPTSPDRCVNTVQNIMNWYQLVQSPTWFWLHALKPALNSEASGYSLGFWQPIDEDYRETHKIAAKGLRPAGVPRTSDKGALTGIPKELVGLRWVTINRGDGQRNASGYTFRVDQPSEVYLLVHDRGSTSIPSEWEPTEYTVSWQPGSQTDRVYVRRFQPGLVTIPGHDGKQDNGWHGAPHLALVKDVSGGSVAVRISDLPEALGGKTGTVTLGMENDFSDLKPGHWTWNPHNWHAVVGFVKHMPWDSTVVKVTESKLNHDARILAFKRPDEKLVFVLSNRTRAPYTFAVRHGREATFKGYRYTPDEAGPGFRGVPIAAQRGSAFDVTLEDRTWEFWVEQ